MKYTVNYNGKEVEVSRLPNGKFKKPNISQFTKQGLGGAWLDDCRIPFNKDVEPRKRWEESSTYKSHDFHSTKTQVLPGLRRTSPFVGDMQKGRFPANVLCEDDVLYDGIERKTGNVKPHPQTPSLFCACNEHTGNHTGDSGSFSRYFSLDAWFAERIKLLPKEAQKTFPWRIVPKASKSEKDRGLEDLNYKEGVDIMASAEWQKERGRNPDKYKGNKNNHSTVKPIKLMSWLITLASREGDTVLDPFCGSGTTAIAAKMLGRQYIGIEREEDYCEIARKRLSAIPRKLDSY